VVIGHIEEVNPLDVNVVTFNKERDRAVAGLSTSA
jgi:hypothetical protein